MDLNWTIAANEMAGSFEVERSFDGRRFEAVGRVPANFIQGKETYRFTANMPLTSFYVRLKMIDRDGKISYSGIILLNEKSYSRQDLQIINNPVGSGNLTFTFSSENPEYVQVLLYNAAGALVYSGREYCYSGLNQFDVPAQRMGAKGSYVLQVMSSSGKTVSARATRL
jgi:hypothetical protein